jgi:2-hydroxy-3-oxopropionate reductase
MVDARGPVGLVGLGQMGGPMARTLQRAGWQVIGWDLSSAARDAAASDGIEIAADPTAVAAGASIVLLSLPDAAAVRAALLGPGGLLAAGRADLLVVDTSTTTPVDARLLAQELLALGTGFLDAPVTGGPAGATAGTLGIMVGGDAAAFERARPALESLGAAVVLCGPAGAGQVVKACNQLIVVATLAAVAEALTIARAANVDPWRAREVLLAGYAASPILENQGARMLRRDFTPGGRARFHVKDADSLAGLSRGTGVPIPVFDAAAGYMRALVADGGGDLDHAAVVTVVERAGGLQAPAAPSPTEELT